LVALPSADAELTLGQLVIERQLAPAETLARAALVQSETGEPLDAVLTRLGLVSERALAEAIAAATGLRIASAADFPAEPIGADRVSPGFLRDVRALPIKLTDRGVEVAFAWIRLRPARDPHGRALGRHGGGA
jgi:general secretion pathway protein E